MSTFAHGYAAMAPEDRADAKRRRAARGLAPYAAARGLEHLGSGRPAGFAQALPRFAEEQQELMRGVLPGGRHGILLHGLLQTHFRDETSSDMPGTYYGVVVKPPAGALKKALKPNRTWIPIIGSWFDDGIDDLDTPFGATGAWSPITICATRVPEAVGRVDDLVLRTRTRAHGGRGQVGDVGQLKVLGFQGDAVPQVLAGPFGDRLRELIGPYWEVRVAHGLLTVQRNGFLVEDADLDALCRRVCALGDALAAACAREAAPAALDEPLPPPPWLDQVGPGDMGGWAVDAATTAAARGLVLEDRHAWHERHAGLPLPGRASLVFRDGDRERVLLCLDQPLEVLRAMRPVLVVPAPEGLAPTPPGGIGVPGARLLVQDGVALVWALEHRGTVGEALDLAATLRGALAAQPA